MSRRFENHLTSYSDLIAWEDYMEYGEFERSNKLSERLSGRVIVYKVT